MTTTEARAGTSQNSLWRNGDFLRFWLGESLSLLGTQVTNLALPLTAIFAFDATDEQVGVLRFLQLAPYLGLALLFGVWVDRVRRRPVMVGANLARMVLPGRNHRPPGGGSAPNCATACTGSSGTRSCGRWRSSDSAATSRWSRCGRCSCCTAPRTSV